MALSDKISTSFPKIDENNRKYVVGGILALIFVLYYFVIMQPQLSTLRTINPEMVVLKQDLERTRNDLQKIDMYKSQIQKLEEKLEKMGSNVQSREEIAMILEKISQVANKHKVRIDQIMPLMDNQELLLTNDEGEYNSLPILIEAKGGYHNFGHFLHEIENHEISLSVARFSIMDSGQDTAKHKIDMTLNTVLFESTNGKK